MPKFIKTILSSLPAAAFMLLPLLNTGSNSALAKFESKFFTNDSIGTNSFDPEMELIYDSLKLAKRGLKKEAFNYAYAGYKKLEEEGRLNKEGLITICDFSQSSCKKRLYIIDLRSGELLLNTFVAHGRNSGGEYARKFSNRPESHQSSLGFYITRQTYYGEHGLSLNIDGLEKGFNDKAEKRRIVIHGSDYIGPDFLRYNKFNGRSYGCPAVPLSERDEVINTIKDGSCLFIYHPTKTYLSRSKILNM